MKKGCFKIFIIQKTSAGFTLIELLVAMAIITIVVSIAGSGLINIMNANKKAQAETERRVELNRALDFMSDEVRTAIKINDSSSAPTWAWTNLGSTGSPSAKLYLQIPWKTVNSMASGGSITINDHGLSNGNAVMFTGSGTIATGLSKNQKYYVRDVNTNTFNVSNTIGGTAKTLTSNSSGNVTLNKLIIYYIRDSTDTWLDPKTINRSLGDCGSNYVTSNCNTLVDSIAENGFTANTVSSRVADLQLLGKLFDNSSATYAVSTKTFARPDELPFTLSSGSASSSGNGGTITITQPSIAYFKILGGDIRCSSTASPIPTKTKIKVTPNGGSETITEVPTSTGALNIPAEVGTEITVTGILEASATNNSCHIRGDYNSAEDNGTQVLTLRNGDSPPLFSPYGTPKTIDDYLTEYLDPATGKVKLAENQVIFLYELYATSSSSAGYDMQDLVVLATIAPK